MSATNNRATLQAWVDKAKSGKGWGVVMCHIVVSGATGNDTTAVIFQGLVDHVYAQGVAVETVGQVMNRI